jgi:ribosomal-protein-alanine N-acetyltransferase
MPLEIRDATLDDWPVLERLERLAFGESASVKWLREEFQRPQSRFRLAIYTDVLGVHETQAVGYCLSWLVAGEMHLLNVAVLPLFRRRGFGAKLMTDLQEMTRRERAECILLEVRESNQPAQGLYEHHGFVLEGRRPRYYRKPTEDALLYRWSVESHV